MTALVVRANAGRLPLPDASVDLICTSPPYFALRSYTDGGEHYAGQIGSEPTPAEFLEALWGCTAEWMRVLKPSGSIWVNLGDKYAGSRMDGSSDNGTGATSLIGTASIRDRTAANGRTASRTSTPTKSLMGLPWRYAIGCIDQLGLILRANVIWSKPNGLPESVTDRVRRSHEDWFHMVKQPRYFSAVDEIREPHESADRKGSRSSYKPGQTSGNTVDGLHLAKSDAGLPLNVLGKLPGSVWEIPSEPLTVPDHLGVDHFAAFPTEWPRRIIQGWSPAGICCECEEGRRPVVVRDRQVLTGNFGYDNAGHGQDGRSGGRARTDATVTGYTCPCDADGYRLAQGLPLPPTRPSLILDPFGGTGTTALCASVLGRVGISVDLSADYGRLAQWRTQDPASRAKAMRVDKPPVQLDGQADLFGDAA